MRIHHPRYILFLVVLILIGVISLACSQDGTDQPVPEPGSAEQTDTESAEAEPPDEDSNPLKSRVIKLEDELVGLERKVTSLQGEQEPSGQFLLYVVIGGTLLTALGALIAIFISRQMVGKLREQVGSVRESFGRKLNDNQQNWEGQLRHIRQRDKDNAEKLEEIVSSHSQLYNSQQGFQTNLSALENRFEVFELTADRDVSGQDEHPPLEGILQEARDNIEALASAYESGEPLDYVDLGEPTPSQKTLQLLNTIARSIEEWKNESEQSSTADPNLVQTLEYANQAIKSKLKDNRGSAPPLPELPQVNADVDRDTAADTEFQNECTAYVSRYEGLLTGLQLACKVDEEEYNRFIPQFVKDRLFNSIAKFVKFDQLPEQLDGYLQLVGYQIVPIEIGKTQADARLHDIQGSQQTHLEAGTVVDVISPGLQRIDNSEIIQKPIVIRGE